MIPVFLDGYAYNAAQTGCSLVCGYLDVGKSERHLGRALLEKLRTIRRGDYEVTLS